MIRHCFKMFVRDADFREGGGHADRAEEVCREVDGFSCGRHGVAIGR